MLTFNGKLALVTGASSGIGNEIARELIKRGSRVIAVARREDKLRILQTECGQNLEYEIADLCNLNDIEKITTLIADRSVDIVVNNAGRGSFGKFEDLKLEDEMSMIKLNIEAFTSITHAALTLFRRRGRGALLGVSSIAAFQPLPYMATYAATKAFEYHLYRALRAEVANTDIFITSLNPGPVATEFAGVARVPGTVTGFNRDIASMVAKRALDALAKNQPFVIPGWQSYFMALSSRIMPTSLSTGVVARALGPVLKAVTRSQ